jgi:hypothetical protein
MVYKKPNHGTRCHHSAKKYRISKYMFGAAETNLKWNVKRNQQAKAILHKHHKTCSVNTSSNREECISAYQPGGILTMVPNKYVGRIQTHIYDSSSLGRWSGFKLNTKFRTPTKYNHCLPVYKIRRPSHFLPATSTLLSCERHHEPRSKEVINT